MAGELKHRSVGSVLSMGGEWDKDDLHEVDGQVVGDLLVFNGSRWVRLAAPAVASKYLKSQASGLIPAWGDYDAVVPTIDFWVNVKDYGAKGDGTTNDTVAIMAAAEVIKDAFVAGGGDAAPPLYFPKGTYMVDGLYFDHTYGINQIFGDGMGRTFLKLRANKNVPVLDIGGPTVGYATTFLLIRDLSIDGNSTNNAVASNGGLSIRWADRFQIKRVESQYVRGYSGYFFACSAGVIEDCNFIAGTHGGLFLDGCTSMQVLRDIIETNGSVSGYGIKLAYNAASGYRGDAFIENCHFEDNRKSHIYVDGCDYVRIHRNKSGGSMFQYAMTLPLVDFVNTCRYGEVLHNNWGDSSDIATRFDNSGTGGRTLTLRLGASTRGIVYDEMLKREIDPGSSSFDWVGLTEDNGKNFYVGPNLRSPSRFERSEKMLHTLVGAHVGAPINYVLRSNALNNAAWTAVAMVAPALSSEYGNPFDSTGQSWFTARDSSATGTLSQVVTIAISNGDMVTASLWAHGHVNTETTGGPAEFRLRILDGATILAEESFRLRGWWERYSLTFIATGPYAAVTFQIAQAKATPSGSLYMYGPMLNFGGLGAYCETVATAVTGRSGVWVPQLSVQRGLVINQGQRITGFLRGTLAHDFGAINDGQAANVNVTVTGAAIGDFALASFTPTGAGATLLGNSALTAEVTATDTVTVTLTNHTGAPYNPDPGTLNVAVLKTG